MVWEMVREFFAWWFGQLAEVLPREFRRSALDPGDALIITPIGPLRQGIEAVAADLRRNGKESPLGHFAVGAVGLAELPHAVGRMTVLRLGEADVLGNTFSIPIADER